MLGCSATAGWAHAMLQVARRTVLSIGRVYACGLQGTGCFAIRGNCCQSKISLRYCDRSKRHIITMPTRTQVPIAAHRPAAAADAAPPAVAHPQTASPAEGGGEEQLQAPRVSAQVTTANANDSDPSQLSNAVPPSPDDSQDDDDNEEEDDGLLFSCRCESARSVTTLLSCLRHISGSSSSGSAAAASTASAALSQARRSRADLSLSAIDHSGRGGSGGGGGGGGSGRAQHATVFAGENGLTFHVHGTARQSQASVDMQSGLFSDYYVCEQMVDIEDDSSTGTGSGSGSGDGDGDGSGSDESDADGNEDGKSTQQSQRRRRGQKRRRRQIRTEVVKGGEFCINLTTVLECLHVLGTASLERTKLCLSYDLHDAIFRIELLEDGLGGISNQMGGGGIVSTCAIPGLAVADDEDDGASGLAIAFRAAPIVARAIVKSDYLRTGIVELSDVPGAAAATIAISPQGVELAAIGYQSECHVTLPQAGNDVVYVSLECDPPRLHARTYPLHSILSAMRGLEIASETCISINARGMVAIQHQVLDDIGNGAPNFVDFIMGCLQDDDEEDEDEDDEERVNYDYDDDDGRHADVVVQVGRDRLTYASQSQRGRGTAASDDEDGGGEEAKRRRENELLRRLGDDDSSDDDGGDDAGVGNVKNGSSKTDNPTDVDRGEYGELTTQPASSSRSSRSQREAERRSRGRRNRTKAKAQAKDPSLNSNSSDDDRDDSRSKKSKSGGRNGKKRPSPSSSTSRSASRRKRAGGQVPVESTGPESDEESTDVESQAIGGAVASPAKDKTKRSSAEDDVPSSPELMYGDSRLETSIDDARKSGTARSRSSAYSDDDTDDDFM